ncbi:hypothetical protein ABZ016_35875 [Streptomyces sp. NPDC006372]|uniref:hypothetical protein n=1 Tax=Streptomyces sp. NPDC006372 TaxID=3155599 RepID=UPI0033A1C81A
MTQDTARAWLNGLAGIVPTPDEYVRFDVDREAALGILRCSKDVLDLLVREGLRQRTVGGRMLFDDSDIRNVATNSGLGTSVPELVQRYVFRFVTGDPSGWISPQTWTVRNLAACLESPDCAGDWAFAPLVCEQFGGRARDTRTVVGAEAAAGGESVDGRVPLARFDATVHLTGEVRRIRDPLVREAFRESLDEMLTGRLRYQAMPTALRNDPAAARANGTVNCISVSLHLQQVFTEAGIRSRTRKGYVVGMLGSEHSWVEVLEDGLWKVVDPVYALLGLQQGAPEDYVEFCLGSILNRLIPCDGPADAETVRHQHQGATAPTRNVIVTKPVKETG